MNLQEHASANREKLYQDSLTLLQALIATPSFSKEEQRTAELIQRYFDTQGITYHTQGNNVWAYNRYFDPKKPTVLLNSHHDTVRPNKDYTRDPFSPAIEQGKLYGLGSNDAGGCLVSLLAAFTHFYAHKGLKYNICMAATAEEEISGTGGLEAVLPVLGELEFAIVGEPTQMQMAIAEKGLLVLDCIARGRSGHAAREEGENAIYKAMQDIAWLQSYRFDKESEVFGPIKMSVTIIKAGTQHNVVPASCEFTVDVRVTDVYTNEQVVEIIRQNIQSEVQPRSVRLKPSSIPLAHPIVQSGLQLGRTTYGSPTTSDQALLSIPSLKMGPGDSARSHTADEFIYLDEIKQGIQLYIQLLESVIQA